MKVAVVSDIHSNFHARALISSHTHIPYHRVVNDVHVINDSSVGKPTDGDHRVCYALIDLGDNISIEFRRIDYPKK
jgi:predicted phosphodiesterase